VVVNDCQFANEAAAVRALGGIVIRLEGRGGIAGQHASERQDFPADAAIFNGHDRKHLQEELGRVLLAFASDSPAAPQSLITG
jgi:hypothetical protein